VHNLIHIEAANDQNALLLHQTSIQCAEQTNSQLCLEAYHIGSRRHHSAISTG